MANAKSDFDFTGGLAQWSRITPEERTRWRTLADAARTGSNAVSEPPSLVILPRALGGDVVAYAIRDADATRPRTILVSRHTYTDRAMLLGTVALVTDEQRLPSAKSRRMLAVSAEGDVTDENGHLVFRIDTSDLPTDESRWIEEIESTVPGEDREIPGFGRGKAFDF